MSTNFSLLRAAILVTFLVSSLVSSISSFGFQYSTHTSMDTLSSSLTVGVNIVETVFLYCTGSCIIRIVMETNSTELDDIYGGSLGFDESASNPYLNQTVPTSLSMNGTYDLNNYKNDAVTINTPSPELEVVGDIPVNSSFCEGIYLQHLLSLGIWIWDWMDVKMCRSTVTGKLLVYVEARGLAMNGENTGQNWTISIGPPNWNVSCDRANYILTQIGYKQEMLNSTFFSGYECYMETWVTTFVLDPFATWSNHAELVAKPPWHVDFGPDPSPVLGTYMQADISAPSFNEIVLHQEMVVRNQPITKTTEELLEQGFLCYKIFNIEVWGPELPSDDLQPASACASGIEDFSWGVDLTLLTVRCDELNVTFSEDLGNGNTVGVNMNVSFDLNLKAHVGLKTKWLKLRKFETWMQFDGDASVDFTLNFQGNFDKSWEQDIFDWGNDSRWYTFWIGPVPVVVRPLLRVTAKLALYVDVDLTVNWGADASGFVRAGVGWKRHRGFYPIFKAGMDVNVRDPDYPFDAYVDVTPSLGFKPILLFYEVVGPTVEIEPYVNVLVWESPSDTWNVDVALGIKLNVGIAFSGWFKEITGLDDWTPATIWNWVLWEQPERPDHDVAVVEVRPPEEAYAYENAMFSADVVNLGSNTETVDVTLYYWDGGSWVEFTCTEGNPQSLSLNPKSCGTLNFTCLLNPPTQGIYTINATAAISSGDGDKGNNNRTLPGFEIHLQDIAIIDLSTSVLVKQQVHVTVENQGTDNIAALPVFLYYVEDGSAHLISDIWCEYMRLEFNLSSGEQATLTFESNTTRDKSDYIAAAPILPHEWYEADNIYPYTCACDIIPNGIVDILDAIWLSSAFGSRHGDPSWNPAADLNGDGVVNIFDAIILANNFGKDVVKPSLP